MAFGFAHIGVLANFLSHSVISGFTSASALIIGFSQAKLLFGIKVRHPSNTCHPTVHLNLNLLRTAAADGYFRRHCVRAVRALARDQSVDLARVCCGAAVAVRHSVLEQKEGLAGPRAVDCRRDQHRPLLHARSPKHRAHCHRRNYPRGTAQASLSRLLFQRLYQHYSHRIFHHLNWYVDGCSYYHLLTPARLFGVAGCFRKVRREIQVQNPRQSRTDRSGSRQLRGLVLFGLPRHGKLFTNSCQCKCWSQNAAVRYYLICF